MRKHASNMHKHAANAHKRTQGDLPFHVRYDRVEVARDNAVLYFQQHVPQLHMPKSSERPRFA